MNDIHRNILEPAKKDFSDTESQARQMTTPTSQQPALWNPYAAARLSLIFSGAFGAFLHARNADAMGRVDEAKANRVWFYIWIAYFGLITLTISLDIRTQLFTLVSMGLLSGWYFSLGQKQARYVRETFRDGYERKPWKAPLLIAFGAWCGWLIITIVFFAVLTAGRYY